MTAWRTVADGLMIDARLTPRSSSNVISGIQRRADGKSVLAIKVRSVPAEGAANAAAIAVLAKALNVAPSQIKLAKGASSRLKTFAISGDPLRLEHSLNAALKKE